MNGPCLDGTLPESVSSLLRLTRLVLHQGRCSGEQRLEVSFYDAMGSLNNLETLSVSASTIIGDFPETFSNMSLLRDVRLISNSYSPKELLTGTLPDSWARLEHLERLELSQNFLSGFRDGIEYDWPSLKHLSLKSSNNFRIHLNSLLNAAPMLEILILSYAPAFGDADVEVWPQNLKIIDLLHLKSLEGKISPSLWNLTSLERISISEIPLARMAIESSIGGMSQLTHLQINAIRLVGSIPEELWKMFDFDPSRDHICPRTHWNDSYIYWKPKSTSIAEYRVNWSLRGDSKRNRQFTSFA